jgi:hypothetical protein
MFYTILIIIGALGIIGTLWINHPKLHDLELSEEDPWYVLHPENFESGITYRIRMMVRAFLKWLLIKMIYAYRKISEQITVKETLKKKVRNFLYEHAQEGVRRPSPFWNKVRHPSSHENQKKIPLEKSTDKPLESDDLI